MFKNTKFNNNTTRENYRILYNDLVKLKDSMDSNPSDNPHFLKASKDAADLKKEIEKTMYNEEPIASTSSDTLFGTILPYNPKDDETLNNVPEKNTEKAAEKKKHHLKTMQSDSNKNTRFNAHLNSGNENFEKDETIEERDHDHETESVLSQTETSITSDTSVSDTQSTCTLNMPLDLSCPKKKVCTTRKRHIRHPQRFVPCESDYLNFNESSPSVSYGRNSIKYLESLIPLVQQYAKLTNTELDPPIVIPTSVEQPLNASLNTSRIIIQNNVQPLKRRRVIRCVRRLLPSPYIMVTPKTTIYDLLPIIPKNKTKKSQ